MAKGKNKKCAPLQNNNSKNANTNSMNGTVTVPFVSVCTPTFNRRPFIPMMLECFNHQDYPKEKLEWIIIDDGTDKIEDLVSSHPNVKYYKYDTKMTLGKKRNLMHQYAKGDIIVYMDDDDYYPPERISHAVSTLQKNKQALCAGSSEMFIYFKGLNKMYKFGPYGPNHATAATFAFHRSMLKDHHYEEDACLAEEKAFLKNYTVPFVQLDPMKTILVFSHEHNTFDKRKLLDGCENNPMINLSGKKVMDFVKEVNIRKFFMEEIDKKLDDYDPGKPIMKPDVLAQMVKIEETRRKMAEQHANQMAASLAANQSGTEGQISIQEPGKPPRVLQMHEIAQIMDGQAKQLQQVGEQLQQFGQMKDMYYNVMKENMKLKSKIEELQEKIEELEKQVTLVDKDTVILSFK